ncbi:hypothetical protein [Streptomyces sp. NPDC051636]
MNMRPIVRPANRNRQPNIGAVTAAASTMFGQKARITDLAELVVAA